MDRALARLIAADRASRPSRLGQSTAPTTRGPLELSSRAGRLSHALTGSSMGKLWLALGALAATAGASFWVGRASVPDEAPVASRPTSAVEVPTPALDAVSLERTQALPARIVETARREATSPTSALASNERALAADARSSSLEGTAPLADTRPLAARARGPAPLEQLTDAADTTRAKQRSPSEATPLSQIGLSAEIQRLARAEAALRRGRAQQALLELEPPATHLREHAAALRAIAACMLDRAPAAPRARETLLRWPASAFAPRIREACGL